MAFLTEVVVAGFLGLMEQYKTGNISISKDVQSYIGQVDSEALGMDIVKWVQSHVEEIIRISSDVSAMEYIL